MKNIVIQFYLIAFVSLSVKAGDSHDATMSGLVTDLISMRENNVDVRAALQQGVQLRDDYNRSILYYLLVDPSSSNIGGIINELLLKEPSLAYGQIILHQSNHAHILDVLKEELCNRHYKIGKNFERFGNIIFLPTLFKRLLETGALDIIDILLRELEYLKENPSSKDPQAFNIILTSALLTLRDALLSDQTTFITQWFSIHTPPSAQTWKTLFQQFSFIERMDWLTKIDKNILENHTGSRFLQFLCEPSFVDRQKLAAFDELFTRRNPKYAPIISSMAKRCPNSTMEINEIFRLMSELNAKYLSMYIFMERLKLGGELPTVMYNIFWERLEKSMDFRREFSKFPVSFAHENEYSKITEDIHTSIFILKTMARIPELQRRNRNVPQRDIYKDIDFHRNMEPLKKYVGSYFPLTPDIREFLANDPYLNKLFVNYVSFEKDLALLDTLRVTHILPETVNYKCHSRNLIERLPDGFLECLLYRFTNQLHRADENKKKELNSKLKPIVEVMLEAKSSVNLLSLLSQPNSSVISLLEVLDAIGLLPILIDQSVNSTIKGKHYSSLLEFTLAYLTFDLPFWGADGWDKYRPIITRLADANLGIERLHLFQQQYGPSKSIIGFIEFLDEVGLLKRVVNLPVFGKNGVWNSLLEVVLICFQSELKQLPKNSKLTDNRSILYDQFEPIIIKLLAAGADVNKFTIDGDILWHFFIRTDERFREKSAPFPRQWKGEIFSSVLEGIEDIFALGRNDRSIFALVDGFPYFSYSQMITKMEAFQAKIDSLGKKSGKEPAEFFSSLSPESLRSVFWYNFFMKYPPPLNFIAELYNFDNPEQFSRTDLCSLMSVIQDSDTEIHHFYGQFLDINNGRLKTLISDICLNKDAVRGAIKILQRIIDYGFMPNAQDSNGDTVFHYLATNMALLDLSYRNMWRDEFVQFLISRGASLDIPNGENKTPLEICPALSEFIDTTIFFNGRRTKSAARPRKEWEENNDQDGDKPAPKRICSVHDNS